MRLNLRTALLYAAIHADTVIERHYRHVGYWVDVSDGTVGPLAQEALLEARAARYERDALRREYQAVQA